LILNQVSSFKKIPKYFLWLILLITAIIVHFFMTEPDSIQEGYTRVSDVLSIFTKYHTVPKKILSAACERGEKVHGLIEKHLNGYFVFPPDNLLPYYLAFEKWKHKQDLEIIDMEHRLYCDQHMVTGKFDLLCNLNGEITLVDWKTSSVATQPIWKLQLSWYNALLSKSDLPQAKKLLVVHLQKEGTYDTFLWQFDWNDYSLCLKTLDLYRYLNKMENI